MNTPCFINVLKHKKITKRTIIYLTVATLLTTSIVACHRGTAEERGERMAQKVTEELELTETQQARLSEVKNEFLEMRKTMRSNLEQTQTDIQAMLMTRDGFATALFNIKAS